MHVYPDPGHRTSLHLHSFSCCTIWSTGVVLVQPWWRHSCWTSSASAKASRLLPSPKGSLQVGQSRSGVNISPQHKKVPLAIWDFKKSSLLKATPQAATTKSTMQARYFTLLLIKVPDSKAYATEMQNMRKGPKIALSLHFPFQNIQGDFFNCPPPPPKKKNITSFSR